MAQTKNTIKYVLSAGTLLVVLATIVPALAQFPGGGYGGQMGSSGGMGGMGGGMPSPEMMTEMMRSMGSSGGPGGFGEMMGPFPGGMGGNMGGVGGSRGGMMMGPPPPMHGAPMMGPPPMHGGPGMGSPGMMGGDPFKALVRGLNQHSLQMKLQEYENSCDNMDIDCPDTVSGIIDQLEDCQSKTGDIDEQLQDAFYQGDRDAIKTLKAQRKVLQKECNAIAKSAVQTFKAALTEASRLSKAKREEERAAAREEREEMTRQNEEQRKEQEEMRRGDMQRGSFGGGYGGPQHMYPGNMPSSSASGATQTMPSLAPTFQAPVSTPSVPNQ